MVTFKKFVLGLLYVVIFSLVMYFMFTEVISPTIKQIHNTRMLKEECRMNPDVCYCTTYWCVAKFKCNSVYVNNVLVNGSCNLEKLCDIANRTEWKEVTFEYCT